MKLVVQIAPDQPEEIRIRAKAADERLSRLREEVERALALSEDLALKQGDEERFVPVRDVLFAETVGDKVWVHTANEMFSTPRRLYELEARLPRDFVRAGKSCLVNIRQISSLVRSPTGVGEAGFFASRKKAFISRMYFKIVRDSIEEVRIRK